MKNDLPVSNNKSFLLDFGNNPLGMPSMILKVKPLKNKTLKTGRNQFCGCGSGLKNKFCHHRSSSIRIISQKIFRKLVI